MRMSYHKTRTMMTSLLAFLGAALQVCRSKIIMLLLFFMIRQPKKRLKGNI